MCELEEYAATTERDDLARLIGQIATEKLEEENELAKLGQEKEKMTELAKNVLSGCFW